MKKRILTTVIPIMLIVLLTVAALWRLSGRGDDNASETDAVTAEETTNRDTDSTETDSNIPLNIEVTMDEIKAPSALNQGDGAARDTDGVIKIYIDQGHNPTATWNTGAVGNGIFEHDINFAVGIRLAELLRQDPRFEVKLSRPTAGTILGYDNSSSLNARSAEANAWGADYFLSIHSNAAESHLACGVEAFSYSDTDEGFPLGEILVDALVEASGFPKRGMFVRPELSVLRKTEMPAVLVELGFVSNPAEASVLASNTDLFAEALYQGFLTYFS